MGLGANGVQRGRKVAAIGFVGADVPLLPGPELGQQVVGIPVQMILGPVIEQRLPGREAKTAVESLAIEGLGESPAGVNPPEGP